MRWLEESIQLDLYPNIERGSYEPRVFHPFDVRHNFVRIGRCDFVRHFVQNHERQAAFNTSHFLHEPDDLISYHSGYGDAIGLMLAEGTILRPPIYRRGALLYDGAAWRIATVGLDDIELVLPGEIVVKAGDGPVKVNPAEACPIALYTRAGELRSAGRPLDRTQVAADRLEFVLVNRQVVGWKRSGNTRIPQNGFVLSVEDGALPSEVCDGIIADAWVEYGFAADGERFQTGIQAGPILLKDGATMIAEAGTNEEFSASREGETGISPVNTTFNTGGRKARSAIGIKTDGDLLLLSVDGCESAARTAFDSAGATLQEIALLLGEAGAVDALNLSGEGSSHLFIKGGLANTPSDRRGQAGVVFERMLPSIGIVG